MRTPLDHPWLADVELDAEYRDSIRVAMKSVVAMLESTNPPEWIVVIDQCYNWFGGFTARTRVVVDEYVTLDVEGDRLAAPITTLLSDSEANSLLAVLKRTTADSLANATESLSLEGSDFAVMVANGMHHWCEFSEFRHGGMPLGNSDEISPGRKIKNEIYSFRASIEAENDGP
jgi:hypothetical protein